jgi:hypothetical protein
VGGCLLAAAWAVAAAAAPPGDVMPPEASAGALAALPARGLAAAIAEAGRVEVPSVDPAERVTIEATQAARWTEGVYDVWHLTGGVRIVQGATEAAAHEAVIWIEQDAADALDFLGGWVLHDLAGAAGEADGVVGDPFQSGGDLHGGDDAAQVAGDRAVFDHDFDPFAVDLLLEFIDFVVVGDGAVAEVRISFVEALHGVAQAALGDVAHLADVGFEVIDGVFKHPENMAGICAHVRVSFVTESGARRCPGGREEGRG